MNKKHLIFQWLYLGAVFLFLGKGINLYAVEKPVLSDWKNPSVEDFQTLQSYLDDLSRKEFFIEKQFPTYSGKHFYLHRLANQKKFRIIEKNASELPKVQVEPIHVSAEEKERCVIAYSSLHPLYKEKLKKLKQALISKGFKGHFLSLVGGWPNIEGGSLEHFDVPYSFKSAMFQEAIRLGYQKVLWLDTRIHPTNDLEEIFMQLEEQSVLFRYSIWPFHEVLSPQVVEALEITQEELLETKHIATGILGFNFTDQNAAYLIDLWEEEAFNKEAFLSGFPEQIPFSILFKRNPIPYQKIIKMIDKDPVDRETMEGHFTYCY